MLFIKILYLVLSDSSLETLVESSSNYTTILSAIIGVIGVIVGAILSFLAQIIINYTNRENERKKLIFNKQMEVYPRVLNYIILYSKVQNLIRKQNTSTTAIQLIEQEKEELQAFYPVFSLITSHDKCKQFNNLKDQLRGNTITTDDAYNELIKILRLDEKY